LVDLTVSLQISTAPREEALSVLTEQNVRAQVENVCSSEVIQHAWEHRNGKGKNVYVHGWIFDISEGRLGDLCISRGPHGDIEAQEYKS
jgi:carbonic anhydrase